MTELSALPSGVFCITLGHSLDDPDVIEYYLEKYPTETEKCLPLALRDMLSPAAEKLGLHPMKIPSARDTGEMSRLIWILSPGGQSNILNTLLSATKLGLAYLIPYILSFTQMDYHVPSTLLLQSTDYIIAGGDVLSNAVLSGNADTVHVLLLLGANELLRTTALHVAVKQIPPNLDIINLLLEPTKIIRTDGSIVEMPGVEINETDATGVAAASSNIDALKFLISRGADVNENSYQEDAPLQRAVETGTMDTVKFLLNARADLHAKNEDALLTAAARGNIDMTKFLLEAKADPNAGNALLLASEHNHAEVIKLLIAAGADIHDNDDEALRSAVNESTVDAARALLEAGADMNTLSDEEIRDSGDKIMSLFAEYERYVPYGDGAEDYED